MCSGRRSVVESIYLMDRDNWLEQYIPTPAYCILNTSLMKVFVCISPGSSVLQRHCVIRLLFCILFLCAHFTKCIVAIPFLV